MDRGRNVYRSVQLVFEKIYKEAVLYFLEKKIMNTDQQLIYAIYSLEGRKSLRPNVELQLYSIKKHKAVDTSNPWFYLGFLCRKVMGNDSHSLQTDFQFKKTNQTLRNRQ